MREAKIKKITLLSGFLILILFLFSISAFAYTTPISYPSHYNEIWLDKDKNGTLSILNYLYGITNVQRIEDDYDQTWINSNGAKVIAEAKYAGYGQYFGYKDGSGFHNLLTLTSDGYYPGGPFAYIPTSVNSFRFALDPNGPGVNPGIWSSLESENTDGLDHMVTWKITGNAGHTDNAIGDYIIAWEDLPCGGDRDFNDSVYQVHFNPIPEPASLSLLGLGLLGLFGLRKRKIT